MIFPLFHLLPGVLPAPDSPQFTLIRMFAAAVTSLLCTILFGPAAIRVLRRHCGERIASDSAQLNELQSAKQGTPTMGGLFIMAALLLSSALLP